MRIYYLVRCLLIFGVACSINAAPPKSFAAAKKIAAKLFSSHRITLYCGCSYDKKLNIDLESCNMQQAQPLKRAHRVEWEHMMPAEHFGGTRACWVDKSCVNKNTGRHYGGRTCCRRIDAEFKQAEAELYNLWPAVGAVNLARSNYNYATLTNKRGFYGCEFDINQESRQVEPPDRAKGIVARATLFMADTYHVKLSAQQKKLYRRWNKHYPPDIWERTWAKRVEEVVGYPNPYISESDSQIHSYGFAGYSRYN